MCTLTANFLKSKFKFYTDSLSFDAGQGDNFEYVKKTYLPPFYVTKLYGLCEVTNADMNEMIRLSQMNVTYYCNSFAEFFNKVKYGEQHTHVNVCVVESAHLEAFESNRAEFATGDQPQPNQLPVINENGMRCIKNYIEVKQDCRLARLCAHRQPCQRTFITAPG